MHHRKRIILEALFCALALTLSGCAAPAATSQPQSFSAYLDQFFRLEASADALSLHYILEEPSDYGIEQVNTSLGTVQVADPTVSAAQAENLLVSLSAYDPAQLPTEQQLIYDILTDAAALQKSGAAYSCLDEPLRPSTGIQAELPILLAEYTFSDIGDVNEYLEILSSAPAFLESICRYEEEKAEKGYFMPDFAADTIIDQCTAFADAQEDHYLLTTFEQKLDQLDTLSRNEKRAYLKQNENFVQNGLLPAYEALAQTLEACSSSDTHTSDSASRPQGLCRLRNGTYYYEWLVKKYTGSKDPIPTLLERTEAQRNQDLAQMKEILDRCPELGDELLELDAHTTEDPLLSAEPEAMLSHLQEQIQEDFPANPDCTFTVKSVDPAMEEYLAPAFYLSAPIDDAADNSIYINEALGYSGLKLFTTLAHEGFPGHLYQNLQFAASDPHPIRTFFTPAGYSEGWATYVEMQSYRYAGLPEPLAQALALEQSAILSLYATADMGIHRQSWTLEDTQNFFADYGFTDASAIQEVYELIVEEPAHYLKYYIGYLEFLELKEYAQLLYAEKFDLKEFHRAVLQMGPAPFDLLKKYLPEYYRLRQ